MDEEAKEWLKAGGFADLVDPLERRGGVKTMAHIMKLTSKDTWEDLEAVACDKKTLHRLVKKVERAKVECMLAEEHGQDVIKECSGNAIITSCFAKAAQIIDEGGAEGAGGGIAKLAKNFLTILAGRMSDKVRDEKAKVGMIETYVLNIHDVLVEIQDERREEKKEGKAESLTQSIGKFFGLKLGRGGRGKNAEERAQLQEAKVQANIQQINIIISM